MPRNPPEGYPRISPYLYYQDAGAAIEWLTRAFGFRERMRMPAEDGRVQHAELEFDGGVVMLGTVTREGFRNPKTLEVNTSSVYVYVDDVDAHFEAARSAEAEILQEPETQPYGDRHYGAKDPEGHEWWFGQHIRDVSPAELGAPGG
ncbi:MAG TPA: VOC family protein [Gaiellaceae bacterium]